MALTAGTRLGVYEVVGPLGAGGMGEVYRAHDTKLGRDVALKLLPVSLAGDPDRLVRLEREARVLASLNHPNIAQIYGVAELPAEGGSLPVLVMELVEGHTLAEMIAPAPGPARGLPLEDVLSIARQIAEALEAAHEQGVVHRDLKPANVKVRQDGTVKVLDFGLAKAIEPDLAHSAGSGGARTFATMTSPAMTEAGVILGTAAYMSPEQARGRTVDRRADIWAFGCVLYEMLTGTPAFARDSITDTLSALTRDEPDFSLRANVPPAFLALIRRCLEKDPRQRLRDIGEARIVLSRPETQAASPTVSTSGATVPSRRPGIIAGIAVGLACAVLASGVTWWVARRHAAEAGPTLGPLLEQITSDAGLTIEPAVSPTGSLLAYASDRRGGGLDIWVQPLPSGEPVQVTHDEADDREPSFSPDGSRIVFRSERDGGGIYVVPALGGPERLVVAKGRHPAFSPDGKRIAYTTGGRGADSTLFVLDAAGGEPRRLAPDLKYSSGPIWSPKGNVLVVYGVAASDRDWWIVDASGGTSKPLHAKERFEAAGISRLPSPAAWTHDYVVFTVDAGDSSSLWSIALSEDDRTLAGDPHRLTASTGHDDAPAVVAGADGTRLFYTSLDLRANLYQLPVAANEGRATGEPQPITDAAANDLWPSVSADGTTLVFDSTRHGASAWLKDLKSGREFALPAQMVSPVVSPDGRSVAALTKDAKVLTIQPVGGGVAREPGNTKLDGNLWDWPAPTLITAGGGKLTAVNPDTGASRPMLTGESGQDHGHGRLSPDGKWVSAMEWTSADRARVIVFPYRETPVPPTEWVAVTDGQTVAEEHAWSPDGNLLYIVSENDGYRCVWAQRLDPGTKHPVGTLMPVLHLHRARRRMISTAGSPQRIAIGPGGIIFGMQEERGNIWMATVK